ncbi:long-chain fatty acid--CoA ligase [Haematospirillum sp. H4485]|nr:long-chain fatty acid--CoA ligase [Haematospirillum sp. H4890]NKD74090.1 long-chain fatty acid--CoA ligase [Haematospirillum sp. H4485]
MPRDSAMTPDVQTTAALSSLSAADVRHHTPDVDWDSPFTPEPLYAALDRSVQNYGDLPYLHFMGRTWTYRDASTLVDRTARGLQDLGVGQGTNVGLFLPNCPYYTILYFAILKAGGTVVNFNPLYVEREIANQVRDAGVQIMVTLDLIQLYPKVRHVLEQKDTPLSRIVVCPMRRILPPLKGFLFAALKRAEVAPVDHDDKTIWFDHLTDNAGDFRRIPVNPVEDVAVLQYTGGTTGIPKGAMLTHANLAVNCQQAIRWFPGVRMGQEKLLCVIPFFHVLAMTALQNLGTAIGAELVLLPRFELKGFLKTINQSKPTLMVAVPTLFTAILNAPDLSRYDLSSLRACISGGAPLPVEVKLQFEKLTGCVAVEGYGLSESSPIATCNPMVGINKPGSIGIPMPGTRIEIRSLDGNDTLMPRGEKGEVCIIGPQVMKGYYNRPEETARSIRDGRLHTGDVGTIDHDGYVYLVDRIKDVILAGGYNIYPRVIEEALYLHPDVAEAVCIAVSDPYRGQAPKCFVRLRDNAGDITPEQLKDFLSDKVSKIEMPKSIEIRDELPKTPVGKLSKKELVAEEAAKSGQEQPPL